MRKPRKSKSMRLATPLISLLLLIAAAPLRPANASTSIELPEALNSVFGNQCGLSSGFLDMAMGHSLSLIGILESLRDDPLCEGIDSVLNSLETFKSQLDFAGTSSQAKAAYQLEREIQKKIYLYYQIHRLSENGSAIPELGIPDLTELRSSLEGDILDTQLSLIETQALIERNERFESEERRFAGYYKSGQYISDLFREYKNNQLCFGQNEFTFANVLNDIIGLSSYFAQPGVAAVASGVSHLAGEAISWIKNRKYNSRISSLAKAQLPSQLNCAVEVLTGFVCETDKALEFLVDSANIEDSGAPWDGMELIFNQLQPLYSFLKILDSGSPTSSEWAADERNQYNKYKAFLDIFEIDLEGYINQTENELSNNIFRPTPDQLPSYLLGRMQHVIELFVANNPNPSPTTQIVKPWKLINFRLLGMDRFPICGPKGNSRQCEDLSDFVNQYNPSNEDDPPGYRLTESDWKTYSEQSIILFNELGSWVISRLQSKKNDDPSGTMDLAFTPGVDEPSPFDLIDDISAYSEKVRNYINIELDPVTRELFKNDLSYIEDTVSIFTSMKALLAKWNDYPHIPDDYKIRMQLPDAEFASTPCNGDLGCKDRFAHELLKDVYQILRRSNRDQYISSRLKRLIEIDIKSHARNNDLNEMLKRLVAASRKSIVSEISDFGNSTEETGNSKDAFRGSLGAAVNLGVNNVIQFQEFFQNYWEDALEAMEDSWHEDELTRFCISTLASKDWNRSIRSKIVKACKGREYKSIFKSGSKLTIRFDDHIDNKGKFRTTQQERFCLWNNFIEKSQLIEESERQVLRNSGNN